jgi:hypothetical protein
MNTIQLQSDKVHQTIERLLLRIHERFPDSSLYNVCNQLLTISKDTQKTIKQISKPIIFYEHLPYSFPYFFLQFSQRCSFLSKFQPISQRST